jgi:hypothetical protein
MVASSFFAIGNRQAPHSFAAAAAAACLSGVSGRFAHSQLRAMLPDVFSAAIAAATTATTASAASWPGVSMPWHCHP